MTTLMRFCAAVLVCIVVASSVAAQHLARDITLARICFAEAGPHITSDCAAINEVIRNGARRRHMRYETFAQLYAREHFRIERRDSRRWIADLTADGHEPAGWPTALSWPVHRAAWFAIIAHARDVIAGRVQHECTESPVHWGQPAGEDLRRALRAGWSRIDCRGSRNAFWGFGASHKSETRRVVSSWFNSGSHARPIPVWKLRGSK